MKIDQLIYLDDIAKTQSMTQTAQRFFISQQALSISLKKLEEEFNATFLDRTNHGVSLTFEGSKFLRKAQTILDTYNELKEEFQFQLPVIEEQLLPGELHILSHARILGPLLTDILEPYTRKYPQIKLTVQEQENTAIIDNIAQGNADFGVIFAPESLLKRKPNHNQYQLPSNILIEQLFSDDFIVCCSCNHPLVQKKELALDNFPNTAVITFDTSMPIPCNFHQSQNSHQYFSNNVFFHKDMIRRRLAVSVITSFEFRKLYFKYKDLTAIPFKSGYKSIISIVTNKERTLSPAAKLFIQMLEKYDFYSL